MNHPTTRSRLQHSSRHATWSHDHDRLLMSLVPKSGVADWESIASHFPGRSQQQVTDRWTKVLNPELIKGCWTEAEDQAITRWVRDHGAKDWSILASSLPGRLGKQCRERWVNSLDPDVVRKPWTEEEDAIIIEKQREWGNKWSKIAELLPGRTDNHVKNRWNSSLKKRLERIAMGLDPHIKRGRKPKRPAPVLVSEEIPKPDFTVLEKNKMDVRVTSPLIQWSPVVGKEPFVLSPGTPLKSPRFNMSPKFSMSPSLFGVGSPFTFSFDGDGSQREFTD